MKELETVPPFEWDAGRIPNDAGPTPHIKIREKGLIVRLGSGKLQGSMTTWAWKTPSGKPVFNFVSENRDFSETKRCLILATGFYEYTAPKKPKVKLKDQHLFALKGYEWLWIAGIVKQDAFSMLTTAPGPDMLPFHDRQIVVLPPDEGMHWLKLDLPEKQILQAPRVSLYNAIVVGTRKTDAVKVADVEYRVVWNKAANEWNVFRNGALTEIAARKKKKSALDSAIRDAKAEPKSSGSAIVVICVEGRKIESMWSGV